MTTTALTTEQIAALSANYSFLLSELEAGFESGEITQKQLRIEEEELYEEFRVSEWENLV